MESINLEKQQWKALTKGDHIALKQLYNRYQSSIFNYALKFTDDKDLIADCVQELFIYLWEKREVLTIPDNPKSYMLRSVRNNLIHQLNKASVNEEIENPENYPFFVSFDTENQLVIQENRDEVVRKLELALAHLTDRQREAVFLRFYEGLSFEEIAGILNITTKACYKLIYRAIDVLKNAIPKGLLSILFLIFRGPSISI